MNKCLFFVSRRLICCGIFLSTRTIFRAGVAHLCFLYDSSTGLLQKPQTEQTFCCGMLAVPQHKSFLRNEINTMVFTTHRLFRWNNSKNYLPASKKCPWEHCKPGAQIVPMERK
jgi:hypothetical protein